jgi:hypothetical protein
MSQDEKSRSFENVCLGTIYRDDEKGAPRDDELPCGTVKTLDIKPCTDEFQGIATYTADNPECTSARGEIVKFRIPKFGDTGENLSTMIAPAQLLAEWEYDQLEQFCVEEEIEGLVYTRVATAAIVPKEPAGFSIGIKNRHPVRQEA